MSFRRSRRLTTFVLVNTKSCCALVTVRADSVLRYPKETPVQVGTQRSGHSLKKIVLCRDATMALPDLTCGYIQRQSIMHHKSKVLPPTGVCLSRDHLLSRKSICWHVG